MTALEIALSYIARGWNPVPVPFRSKKPVGDDWQHRVINAANAAQYFNNNPQNIGALMGPSSNGLTDVDLDCAEAAAISPFILPKTHAIFGRASSPYSHWLYSTSLGTTIDAAALQFRDPKTKEMLVELRIGGNGKGAQTIFPGSTHKETGEEIKWHENGEPAHVADLLERVRLLAACCLLARYWPAARSSRHEYALVVGGFLSRCGIGSASIKVAVEAIARAAHDEEWRDRRKAAEDAANAHHEGKRTYGLKALRELYGPEIANQIAEWLGYQGGDEPRVADNIKTPEQPPPSNLCTPYVWSDPATLPKRGWLYGKHYIRQYVSCSAGEGGVGKSTLALTEAVVMIVRRALLGKMPSTDHPLRVWYWNGEDPKIEIELRIAAICQRFGIDGCELLGKLFIDGRDSPISIAAINRGGTLSLNDATLRLIADKITQNAIDVLILDPFIACHSVSENDNMAIDAVIKALGRVAEKTNCAIDIDHHTRKPAPSQDSLTLNDARGASAIVFGVRSGRIFNQMSTAEADKAGLNPDDRKAYFRFDRAKANMAPAEFAVWHHLVPMTLPNGEEVAAVEQWEFPNMFEGVTTAHMHTVRQKVQEGEYRADIRSKDWVGYAVLEALNLGRASKDKTRAKNIIKTWFENGVLTRVEKEDPKSRKTREFVVPGDWNE